MRRRVIGVLAGLALVGLAMSAARHPPRLVWNASASAPIGLYRVVGARLVQRGDLVLVRTPPQIAALAAQRGYLPLHVPLVKRVAAMPGDQVCTQGDVVTVGHAVTVLRVAFDRHERPLPYWEGCRSLRAGQVFLLMRDAPYSFDSRYFGPVSASSVIGVLRPLWTR